ncbi:MAG: hypothetical protein KAI47_13940, partial [Deltaproteobacteria bacterium]|nr:hypothetical protein [Deltaproteobacteria bacterium]
MAEPPHDQLLTHDELLTQVRRHVMDLGRRHLLIRILRDLGVILGVIALAILVALFLFARLQIAPLRSLLIFGG